MNPIKSCEGRKAIAMIELIFAIAVMGIALMSVPNLISIAAKSGYVSMQQEAIATAASHFNLIMTKQWDENNVIDTATGITSTVILHTLGSSSLVARAGAKTRTYTMPLGTEANASTTIGSESNDFDDMDDYADTNMTLRTFSTADNGDIIDTDIIIKTHVNYANDATSGANDYNITQSIQYNFSPAPIFHTTNIKAITTKLTTNNTATELAKEIHLYGFAVNIGAYEPARRSLP